MKKYKFIIKNIPSVISGGEIIEDTTVFSCELLVDRNTDINAFAKQLFSFWEKSDIMGEAQNKWRYEFSTEQV